MKIVISGKGGAGKTTISGTMARIFADKGYKVIAVDSDPSMNLHTSVGLDNPEPISSLKDLINERAVIAPGMYNLSPKVDDIPEHFSSKRGNLKLLVMGTIEEGGQGCICPETTFLRALLRHLVLKRDELLILDTEAGVEHLGRKVAENFDIMLIVVEPSIKSVETARHIYKLSKDIGVKRIYAVANKISGEKQKEFLKERLEIEFFEFIPFDEKVIQGDMENIPLVDIENSTALKKIIRTTERIEKVIG